jgi:hypothetical protein
MTPEEKKAAEEAKKAAKEAKKAAKEAVQQLEKEAELRKRIAESSGEYVKLMKDLKNLNKDINTVTQQIEQVTARLATTLTPEQTAIETEKLNILQKQLAVLTDTQKTYTKVIKETNKYAKSLAALGMAAKDVKSIYSTISGGYSKFKSWSGLFEVDKSIRTASTSMGLLGTRSDMFRKNLQLAAGQTTIFGADIKELAEIQGTFSDELGRASLLSSEALVSIAKIGRGTGIGAEGAAKMAADFENQGISAERTAKFIQQVVDDTSRMGINSSKVVKNIQQNVKLLNKYNFKDGAKGLAKMAERAAKLGIDMNITSSMAEKLFDLEGAVDMSAQLQVLGGEWSKLADPFKLMYMARNDMDGLEESVINATTASATFNEKNGEFEIGAMEMQRLRKVAEAANLDFEKLADTAKKTAKAVGKRNQIRYNFDPETKEFIENTSTLNEKGEAVIQLQSGKKLVKQLNQADKSAIEAAIKEKASLEKRAQEAKTFDETLNDVVTQFKQLLLPFLTAFDTAFRPVAIELSKVLADENVLKGIAETAKIAADLMGFVGKFIAENPLKSIAIAIGGLGLLETVKWRLMGVSFGLGFNSVASVGGGTGQIGGQMFGMRNSAAMSRAGLGTLGKVGANFKGALGSFGAIGGGLLSAGISGYDEYNEQMDKGKSKGEAVGRAALKGAGAGAGAWAGAAAGAAIGSVVPVVGTLIGGLIGGALGAYGGGKLADLDTYGVEDGIFGGSKKSRRAILEGKNVTPIDNKDDILAMKPGGIVDKVMSQSTGVNTVKHEFGTLNISGEITLNVPGNEKININLAKSPEFVREITRMVHVEAAKIKNQIQKG